MNLILALICFSASHSLAASPEIECTANVEQCENVRAELKKFSKILSGLSAERRAGRDGYKLLHRMTIKFEAIGAGKSPEANAVALELKALIRTNPDFLSNQGLRLSDEIEGTEAWRQDIINKARTYVWNDNHPKGYFGEGKNLVVRFQRRLEFFRLPADIEFKVDDSAHLLLIKTLTNGTTHQISLSSLSPTKTMSYKRKFEILPRIIDAALPHFMLCTYAYPELGESFSPVTPYEQELARQAGQYFPRYVNKDGLDDFCGILTSTGDVQFSFPVTQKDPDTLLWPIGMKDKHAAVAVGEKMSVTGPDEPVTTPGNFREVLIWDYPSKLRRVKVEPKNKDGASFRSEFSRGNL